MLIQLIKHAMNIFFSDLEVEKDVKMLIPQNEAKKMREYMKIRKFWM